MCICWLPPSPHHSLPPHLTLLDITPPPPLPSLLPCPSPSALLPRLLPQLSRPKRVTPLSLVHVINSTLEHSALASTELRVWSSDDTSAWARLVGASSHKWVQLLGHVLGAGGS